jgi:hypothetical protein
MSGSVVTTYDPSKVLALVMGVPATGLDEDNFINIAPVADISSFKVGANGEIARALNTNKCFTVDMALLQTSAFNDYLSGLLEADGVNGGLIFPFMVQDLRGRTMFMAAQAWIAKRPAIGFGSGIGNRTWQFVTAQPSIFIVGGNL